MRCEKCKSEINGAYWQQKRPVDLNTMFDLCP